MSTVWLSATETEVYALSLLLSMLMLATAHRAGSSNDHRWILATAYLFSLAAPLHLSALVAAPAAILLAASDERGKVRRVPALALTGSAVLAAGLGSAAWMVALGGVLIIAGAAALARDRGHRLRLAALPALVLLGASIILVMIVRAQHDPAINQGNPATLQALLDVVARRQYSVAPLWPRQAPLWLQIVNFFQYADWQVALGLAPRITVSAVRSIAAMVFVALALVGSVHHRDRDVRSWRVLLLLLVSGSLGVIAYLNLKAGPTIGHGILPELAPHEPRERDYFFVLAFWSWGLWAGVGAVALAKRWLPRAAWCGLVVAIVPVALNWSAADRKAEPIASLPRRFASELLMEAPENSVLFVRGDNDTYPLWYMQHVIGARPDVTVVTMPMLAATWYREELGRRHDLVARDAVAWQGSARTARAIADRARQLGRPVAAAVTVEPSDRAALGESWTLTGLVYVENVEGAGADAPRVYAAGGVVLDSVALVAAIQRLGGGVRGSAGRLEGTDAAPRRMQRVLRCPGIALGVLRTSGAKARDATWPADSTTAAADSLDSICNLR